jgi:hypothetical protein
MKKLLRDARNEFETPPEFCLRRLGKRVRIISLSGPSHHWWFLEKSFRDSRFSCGESDFKFGRPSRNSDEEEHTHMKLTMIGLLGLAVLVFALAFSVAAPAAPHSAATTVAAAATVPGTPTATPSEHHEIHEALESLRRAREHMAHAAHDFHGHREDAVRATDEAIRQLEICLKYD